MKNRSEDNTVSQRKNNLFVVFYTVLYLSMLTN